MVDQDELEKMLQLNHCAVFNFRKMSRAITQWYEKEMRGGGLKATQFTILAVLHSSEKEFTVSLLSEVLVMERTTLTRNLKPLTRDGMVEVVVGDDRRQRIIQLTDKGQEALEQALPSWRRAQQKMMEIWNGDYLETLENISQTIQQVKQL